MMPGETENAPAVERQKTEKSYNKENMLYLLHKNNIKFCLFNVRIHIFKNLLHMLCTRRTQICRKHLMLRIHLGVIY